MTPAEEQLSAYLDDELEPAQRAAVESLLEQDSELRKTLEQLQQVRNWMHELPSLSPNNQRSITELLTESSKTVSPSLSLEGDGLQPSGWLISDWRWPLGLVAAATLALAFLPWWLSPTQVSDLALSSSSKTDSMDRNSRPAEVVNSAGESGAALETPLRAEGAMPDVAAGTDAFPSNQSLAELSMAKSQVALGGDLENAEDNAKDKSTDKSTDKSVAAAAMPLAPSAEAAPVLETALDSKEKGNARVAEMPVPGDVSRLSANANDRKLGEMPDRDSGESFAGGLGGGGGMASKAAAPGIAVPRSNQREKFGSDIDAGSARKEIEPGSLAEIDSVPGNKAKSSKRADAVGAADGLGGADMIAGAGSAGGLGGSAGGLGGSAGGLGASAGLDSAGGTMAMKNPSQSSALAFDRIYQEKVDDKSKAEEGEKLLRIAEVTAQRFEDLLDKALKDTAPNSVKIYRLSSKYQAELSKWKEELGGAVQEIVPRRSASSRYSNSAQNRLRDDSLGNDSLGDDSLTDDSLRDSVDGNSSKKSANALESAKSTWVLLQVTEKSWTLLSRRLEQAGADLGEMNAVEVARQGYLLQPRGPSRAATADAEKDQRILILVNLQ